MTTPDALPPVHPARRSGILAAQAVLFASALLLTSLPLEAGSSRGGGGSVRSGSSHSSGGRSSAGGGRSHSAGPRASSSGRSTSAAPRSGVSLARGRSSSPSAVSSPPTRSYSGDRPSGSSGSWSSSGSRGVSATGTRGGSGGPPPSGGNPGGGHPGGGRPGDGGGHPGVGGYHGGGHHGGGYRGWYCPPTYWVGSPWAWGPWDWWWGWGPAWGWGWGGYWGGVYVVSDGQPAPGTYAIVDTDVSPEAAEVYLDGTFIGSADDFDGFPDYLYLEPGKYKLEFRHPFYETVVKEIEVRRGQGVRFEDEMKLLPGKKKLQVVDPEDRGTPLGRVFGRPEATEAARGADRTGRFDADGAMDSDEPTEVPATDVDVLPPSQPRQVAPGDEPPPQRGRIRFDVEPEDAAVYLDDRYVGTGEELAGLRRGLPVKPGRHTVVVIRPGFATRTVEVEAKPGSAVDVVVELER